MLGSDDSSQNIRQYHKMYNSTILPSTRRLHTEGDLLSRRSHHQLGLDDIVKKGEEDSSLYTEALKLALLHRRVNIVGYNPLSERVNKAKRQLNRLNNPKRRKHYSICMCCGRFPRDVMEVNFQIDKLGFLGPGFALYFTFQQLCIIMLILLYLCVISNHILYSHLQQHFLNYQQLSLKKYVSPTDFLCFNVTIWCLTTLAIFSRYMNNLCVNVDGNDTSPQDYSVLVTNLPLSLNRQLRKKCKWNALLANQASKSDRKQTTIQQQLKQFFQTVFRQRTKVQQICMCYNLIPLGLIEQRKKQMVKSLKDLYDCRQKEMIFTEKFGGNPIKDMINVYGVLPENQSRRKDIQGRGQVKRMVKEQYIKLKMDVLNQRIEEGYTHNQLLFVGEAIISFEKQSMAEYVLQNIKDVYFYGNKLQLSRPEHPKGVYWHNLHLTTEDYSVRNTFSLVSCSAIFLCSLFLQISLSYLRYRMGYQSKIMVLLSSMIVNIINMVIPAFIIRFFSSFQGHRTRTDQIMSFVRKSFILQLMNTLFVPLVVIIAFSRGFAVYFSDQNGVMFRNAIFPIIQLTFSFKFLWKQFVVWCYKSGYSLRSLIPKHITVREFCEMHQYPPFEIQTRASQIMKTMMLTFFLAFQSRKVALYAIISFYFSYWIDKYNLSRCRVVKYHINLTLNKYMMRVAHLSIAIFLACQLFMYNRSVLKLVLFIICLILYFKPFIYWIGNGVEKVEVGRQLSFQQCRQKLFETDYKRENPALRGISHRIFLQKRVSNLGFDSRW